MYKRQVATSAIVTTLVIVAGVILMIPLRPVLENPVLVPAFDNVVPAQMCIRDRATLSGS